MNFKRTAYLLCYILLSCPIWAIPAIDWQQPIVDIHYDSLTLPQDVIKDAVTYTQKLKGKPLTPDNVNRCLEKWYKTGYFSAVSASTSSNEHHDVSLIIHTKQLPTIQRIVCRENLHIGQDTLLKDTKLHPGLPLNLRSIHEDRETIEYNASQEGYDFLKVTSISLEPDNTLLVILTEGTIDTLTFTGLQHIQPSVVKRILRASEGQVFNSQHFRQDREKLLKLNFFSDISTPKLSNSTVSNHVNVALAFFEKKPNQFDIGLEQDSLNGLVSFVSGSLYHTIIHSDRLTGKVQFGNDTSGTYKFLNYSVQYNQPWLLNTYNLSVFIDAWNESKKEFIGQDIVNQTLTDTTRKGLQLSAEIPLGDPDFIWSIKGKSEQVLSTVVPELFDTYLIRSLSTGISYRTVFNLTNPKKGFYGTIDLEKGGSIGNINLGGLQFSRLVFNSAIFFPLNTQDTIACHANISDYNAMNASITTEPELFVLGGAGSLRGYKEISPFIGPHKVLFNAEFRHDFSTTLQGVIFYDTGKIFKTGDDFWNLEKGASGYGAGIRFFTPLGPLRVDVAWGEFLIIHFGLGQVF